MDAQFSCSACELLAVFQYELDELGATSRGGGERLLIRWIRQEREVINKDVGLEAAMTVAVSVR